MIVLFCSYYNDEDWHYTSDEEKKYRRLSSKFS